jgi:hypothetical protein
MISNLLLTYGLGNAIMIHELQEELFQWSGLQEGD